MMPWRPLAMELVVSGWILVLLVADALLRRDSRRLWVLALAGVFAAAGVLAWVRGTWTGEAVEGMFVADAFAAYFKGLLLLTTAIVILMTRRFAPLADRAGAFYMLLFTALLGGLVLASVQDFLMLFIGLELLTFSLYIMAAYLKTDGRSIEAGMKYLVLGSVSSAFLVYGIALLYGFAGGTSFAAVSKALAAPLTPPIAQAGMFLVLAGLGFKVAALPFNFWVPDVYEGAPTPVVAMLSVGSKMSGIVALIRVLYGVLLPLQGLWGAVLPLVAAGTMVYGNLGALPQTNIKRLLGYSSIGHAGYLLMGLSTATPEGVDAVGYYLLAYLFSTLAVFFAVVVASESVGGDALEDYDGLSRRSPLLAAVMFVGLLSLAGVPPLAGFVGKLLVLLAATESRLLWLVALGAVNVAMSLYYYLMVVKRMYLGTPRVRTPIAVDATSTGALLILAAGIVLIGVFQQPFLEQITYSLRLAQ